MGNEYVELSPHAKEILEVLDLPTDVRSLRLGDMSAALDYLHESLEENKIVLGGDLALVTKHSYSWKEHYGCLDGLSPEKELKLHLYARLNEIHGQFESMVGGGR